MAEPRLSNEALIEALTLALGAVFSQMESSQAEMVISTLRIREDGLALDPKAHPDHAQAIAYVRRRLALVASLMRDAEQALLAAQPQSGSGPDE